MKTDTEPSTQSDLISLKLEVQAQMGDPERQAQLIGAIDALAPLVEKEAHQVAAAIKKIEAELNEQRRWVPILALFGLLFVATFIVLKFGSKVSTDDKFLGFSALLVCISLFGGFLGSFVRVLNKAVKSEYSGMSSFTTALVAFIRPLAGAALGLFMLAIFGSGVIAMPIGKTGETLFANITKGEAFIFAAAFVAGIVDDFALSLANRIAGLVKGHKPRPEPEGEKEAGRVPKQGGDEAL